MKAYKAFNSDMTCRGFQYKEGETYKMDGDIKLCERGFHACENPLDVLAYYPPTSPINEVELNEVSDERKDDSKVVAREITIGAKISLASLTKFAVDFIFKKIDWNNAKETNTGYYSAATNTGYQSAATNTGYRSAATNTGNCSAATNTGYRSAATNTGDYSAATNTGDYSAAEVSGLYSVAIATGCQSKVKGKKGCAIVCVERGEWDGSTYPILCIKSDIVDGKRIKEDVWYTVESGEWKEVN